MHGIPCACCPLASIWSESCSFGGKLCTTTRVSSCVTPRSCATRRNQGSWCDLVETGEGAERRGKVRQIGRRAGSIDERVPGGVHSARMERKRSVPTASPAHGSRALAGSTRPTAADSPVAQVGAEGQGHTVAGHSATHTTERRATNIPPIRVISRRYSRPRLRHALLVLHSLLAVESLGGHSSVRYMRHEAARAGSEASWPIETHS